MRVGEYGIQFVAGTGFNLSNFTQLQIKFTRPDGTVLTVNATAPAPALTTTLGLIPGSTYASYTFLNGDVNQAGNWFAQVFYTDASPQHLISGQANFTINS